MFFLAAALFECFLKSTSKIEPCLATFLDHTHYASRLYHRRFHHLSMILCFSRMRSEGFPFIVWGSGGLGAGPLFASSCSSRRRGVVVASSSRRHGIVNTVSMGETVQNLSLCLSSGVAVSMGEAATPRLFCCALVAVFMRKLQNISLCLSSASMLWGKLRNIVRFAALTSPCFLGEAAKHRSFCCAHVTVSGKLQNLSLCLSSGVSVSMGEAAKTSVSSRVSASPLASPCLWGKLQNIARFAALTSPCLWGKLQNLSLCLSSGVSVSMGEAAEPQSRLEFLLLLWHRRVYGVSCKTSFVLLRSRHRVGEAAKPQSLLVFWRLRVYGGSCKTSVSSRVSASPLASPCLWGKLQNIVRFAVLTSRCLWGKLQNIARFVALTSPCLWGKLQNLSLVSSFCFSSGISVSMGEAAKHRSFCCAHVAVPMGQAAKPQSLLVFWRLRAYGGSCKTSLVLLRSRCRVYGGSCETSQSLLVFWRLASPCLWGKLQKHRSFCCTI